MREGRRLAGLCACQSFFYVVINGEHDRRHLNGAEPNYPQIRCLNLPSIFCVPRVVRPESINSDCQRGLPPRDALIENNAASISFFAVRFFGTL